jgi:hypothetical protein
MLLGVLHVMAAASILGSRDKKQRALALLVVVLTGFIVLASRRRAAVIGTEVALIVLGLTLLMTNWKSFAKLAPLVVVVGVIYAATFWNNPNSWGQPVRSFRAVFDSQSVSQRDRASDDYREAEKLNVLWSIRAQPLDGIGFGVPYAKPLPFPNLSGFWPFWDYIPHNTILWLWLKGGVLLFAAFWFLLGTSLAQAAGLLRRVREPLPVAIVSVITAYFVMVVLFAYVDLGLMSTRLMAGFGAAMGLLSVIERLWLAGPSKKVAAAQ